MPILNEEISGFKQQIGIPIGKLWYTRDCRTYQYMCATFFYEHELKEVILDIGSKVIFESSPV